MIGTSKADRFQESLEALDLQGLILVIGLLSQRALELMVKDKAKETVPGIIKPEIKLV